MADPRILIAVGVVLVLAGAVALVVVLARRGAGQPAPAPWTDELPPARTDLTAPDPTTELLPAVRPGRHWYPGTAEDSGAIPRHGWRPGEQTGAAS